MNILYMTTHLNTGGITSYLYTLSKGLVKRGHKVHIVSSGGDMEKEFSSIGTGLLIVNIRTKSELDPRIYTVLSSIKRYIEKNDIDIIHAHTRITQVMGTFLKKMTGKPYISTCHGFFKLRLSRKIFPCWGDVVIAISNAVKQHLIDDFGIKQQKVYLINSGVDINEFTYLNNEEKAECRSRFNLGSEPVIGMIARFSDVKGPDILIKSMKRVLGHVPNARLLLIGEGRMEKTLRNLVKNLHIEKHVRFLPVISNTNSMLSLMDIFAMPSRQEGLGISIMEAQAAGIPVIATRVGGIPSLIEDGKTGVLVEPEDPDALAEAIINLLNDKERLRAIGDAGCDFIQKNNSADQMINRTAEIYQYLLS